MALQSIFSYYHGEDVRFGRNATPTFPSVKLRLEDYIKKDKLPDPPDTADYTAPALPALNNVMVNNKLGCCVISGMYAVVGVWTGGAGNLFNASDAQVISDYSAIGGYQPGNPSSDQGCNEEDALNWWVKNGTANGDKPLGWLAFNATDAKLVRQVIWIFEHAYWGVQLPDAWVNPMPQAPGFNWDVAGSPDPGYGHCVMSCAYKSTGPNVRTWGMLGWLTDAAVAKYMVTGSGGEAYIFVSRSAIQKASGRAPSGLDLATMESDFNSLGGSVPVDPPIPPAPGPVPAPPDNGGGADYDHYL